MTKQAQAAAPVEAPVAAPETTSAEQTQGESFVSNSVRSQRDDLIETANEAAESDGESPADDKTAAPKAEKPKAAASTQDNLTHVAKVLREKKERERRRVEGEKARQQVTAKLEQERAQYAQQEARLRSEYEAIEREKARLREVQRDPMKVAELAGMTPEQLAQNLVMQGTPEFQEAQRIRRELEELKNSQAEYKRLLEEQRDMAEKHREQERVQFQRAQETNFIAHTQDAEKYPALSRMSPKHRIMLGYDVAEEYYRATNKIASDAEIAEYLEDSLSGQTGNQPKLQPSGTNGKAPVSRANSPRTTLSSSVASERRSSPKPVSNDLRGEDLRKELLAAAREAALTST